MKPGQVVEIALVDKYGKSVRFSNAVVEFNFLINGKYRYGFKVGRTTGSGTLVVSYDEIEDFRRKAANQFAMDYNTKLEDCDPMVEIVVPSERELRKQYENVVESYKSPPVWAKDWPSNGRIGARKLVELADKITVVQIPTESA